MTSIASKKNDTWKKINRKNKKKIINNNNNKNKFRILIDNNWDINKSHYIPKSVKSKIDDQFKKSLHVYDFFKQINKEIHFKSKIRTSAVIYCLHQAASYDNLSMIEYILDKVPDRKKYANSKCGTMEYTPIFRSAYKGSIKALKMFICAGADLNKKNKINESVLEALEQGLQDSNKSNPDFKIFYDERYDECRNFIVNYKPMPERIIKFKKLKFNKKNTKIVNEKNDTDGLNIDEYLDSGHLNGRSFLKYIEYQDTHNKKDEFDIFDNLIIISIKKTVEIYNKIVNILMNISNIYINRIKNMLLNEMIIDIIKFDAPFAKDGFNKLRKKYGLDNL